jgi:hypothetical protein
MKSSHSTRLWQFTIAIVAILTFLPPAERLCALEADAAENELVAQLRKSWPTVGLDALASSEFDCFCFKYVVHENSKVSKKDLDVFIDNAKTAWKTSGDWRDIVEVSKFLPLPQEFVAREWAKVHIAVRGQNWRTRIDKGFLEGKSSTSDYCYADRKEVAYFSLIHSADVYDGKSAWSRYGIEDMILAPPVTDETQVVHDDPGADLVTMKTPSDADNHCIFQVSRSTKQLAWMKSYSRNRTLSRYDLQFGFAEYDGGDGGRRLFPAVTILARLSPEQMVLELDVIVKDRLQFNHAVPARSFRVAAPKDTLVYLYSGNGPYQGTQLGYDKLRRPIDDVLSEALPQVVGKIGAEKRAADSRSADLSWLYWIAAGNVLILGGGVVCWRLTRRFRR